MIYSRKNFKNKNSKRLTKNLYLIFSTFVIEAYKNSKNIKPSYYSVKNFKITVKNEYLGIKFKLLIANINLLS